MKTRRDFITVLGGAAAAGPLSARAQQPGLPVVGFVSGRSSDDSALYRAAFRQGLTQAGAIEDQNVTVEYHWLDGRFDQLPALMDGLVHRRVAAIATPGTNAAALAAKAATPNIPIIFSVSSDPVALGLVPSLARPGGNLTGFNFFSSEVLSKRLQLLHELVPNATRIAALANPSNDPDADVRTLTEGASAIGLELRMLYARTSREIEAAFTALVQERAEALFVVPDVFFASRRAQFANFAAHYSIPATLSNRDAVEAGVLMSYGADIRDTYRQVGTYTGRILKGEKPGDLPVQQSNKFEFVINLQTARLLGIEVPPSLLLRADEAIE
jgi:putative ABC transport system substrate-binding protein